MTRVKICGLTNLEDALAAAELGADALGFVFAESPRRISLERAAEIVRSLPPFLTCVGLFVDELPEMVREAIKECRLNALQFHGTESPDYCRQFMIKTIKAFRLRNENSLETIPHYRVDAYLLDTYVEGIPGGTGESFNWDLALRARELGRPIILAGGLKPDNVAEAIGRVKPYGVDVSTGVEAEPGKKDYKKMKEFIKIVRSEG
ncbi:phosphoribosylanthranilate isomerase [candidate division NPL-UPA2 bacterium]|nr:phosphoribosylanthranilate isomerase [candidate division NPL-UPA2 bacterium]